MYSYTLSRKQDVHSKSVNYYFSYHVLLRIVSEMAQQEVDTVVSIKKKFLLGEMCYFMVNSWRLRFGALELRFG